MAQTLQIEHNHLLIANPLSLLLFKRATVEPRCNEPLYSELDL